VCCFDKQGLNNLDRPFWRGFITRQPFQLRAQLACACVRNCVYDNRRNGNPNRNNALCLSTFTSHFGSPMFCNSGTWATTRVGRVGHHIKPNNFSIIYIRTEWKTLWTEKKTVFKYLLLYELSDVCEKKLLLYRIWL